MSAITENEATLIQAGVPKEAAAAVMVKSETMPEGSKHMSRDTTLMMVLILTS